LVLLNSIRRNRTGSDVMSLTEGFYWHVSPSDNTVGSTPLKERKNVFDEWVTTPEVASRSPLKLQLLTQELLAWTKWSQRNLAAVLSVSHSTVSALEQGTSPASFAYLHDRLVEAHTVVRRINLIAEQDPSKTNDLLSKTSAAGSSAETLLAQRKPADAYLAALDALRPRRVEPMIQGIWPAKSGDATQDLAEDPV